MKPEVWHVSGCNFTTGAAASRCGLAWVDLPPAMPDETVLAPRAGDRPARMRLECGQVYALMPGAWTRPAQGAGSLSALVTRAATLRLF